MSAKNAKKEAKEKSYEIRPHILAKFYKEKIYKEVKDILDSKMNESCRNQENENKYNHEEALNLSKEISDCVRDKLKEEAFNLTRYKIMVHTIIGEKKGQGIKVGLKCMWDTTSDGVASASWENEHTYAFCIVYGVYFY